MRTLLCALLLSFATVATPAEDAFKAGAFTFQKPAGFKLKETPPGGMRAAQLEYAAEGKTAEVVFFFFGQGQGGGTQANVDRWIRTFPDENDKKTAKTEKKKIGSTEITFVEVQGTYSSGMPGGPSTPQPNSKLVGAIMESPGGNVYVRFVGPAAAVKAGEAEFRKMIETAK